MSKVMLCTDSASAAHPECIGLEGESLDSLHWLEVRTDAHKARSALREGSLREVWVAGSNDMEGINLAAALKREPGERKVCLLAFKGNGSLRSRAQAAGIDEVWDKHAFLNRYAMVKSALGALPSAAGAHIAHQEKAPANVSAASCEVERGGRARMVVPEIQAPALEHSPASKELVPRVAAHPAERGFLLSVVGAGGGVGKSSVAVIAAYLAQSMGYRTALVDADLQFGDVQYLTGREDVLPLEEAVEAPARIGSLSSHGRNPAILSAPKRLEHSETVAAELPRIIEEVRRRFEVVVVNTAPAWADTHLQLLEAGGTALFLLDQRPSSIRACKHAISLCARCGVATQPIVFALNRCSRQSLFSSIDVSCALQGAHVVELAEGGRDVEELLGTGAPIELLDSGNALCQSIARVLGDVLPRREGDGQMAAAPSRRRFRLAPRRKKAACL